MQKKFTKKYSTRLKEFDLSALKESLLIGSTLKKSMKIEAELGSF